MREPCERVGAARHDDVAEAMADEIGGVTERRARGRARGRDRRARAEEAPALGDAVGRLVGRVVEDFRRARPAKVLNHPPDQTTDRIAERWGLLGPRSTITTACSSSGTSLGYAADLIRHGFCDVVVTGGADTFARLTH